MKKVFAIMSVLLLTIAFIGLLSTSTVSAAGELFTKDPTLAEDEVPVYIMDSIYSTFPKFYDNNAAPDASWPGTARMYPWNETRLRVAILDDNGAPTGKYYAVFFTGALNGEDNGAGNNLLFFDVDASGNAIITRKNASGWASGGSAMDQSLSHMRKNISSVDLEFNPLTVYADQVAQGTNIYNRSVIFDGQGRMIRGIGLDSFYADPATTEDAVVEAEFCYVNGLVTKMEEGTVCDKVKEAVLDENGDAVLDGEGNPTYTVTDKDNILYSRFCWEWFSEKPENVNTVPYLSEGWRAAKWDYCYEKDGGYMCIAFTGSASNSAGLTPAQTEVEAASAAAAGEAAATVRDCYAIVRVPAGGILYDLGYLDRDTAAPKNSFFDMVNSGYKYGRQAMGESKTYNFSSKGIYNTEKVIDGNSYQFKEGTSLMEVKAGVTIKPNDLFKYDGLASGFIVQDDATSFSKDLTALKVTISLNGTKVVTPNPWKYNDSTVAEMMTDFFEDLRGWYAHTLTLKGVYELDENGEAKVDEEGNKVLKVFAYSESPYSAEQVATTESFITAYCSGVLDSWGLFNSGSSRTSTGFLNQPEIQDKWETLTNYLNDLLNGAFWSSAYTSNVRIRNYYQGTNNFPAARNGADYTKTPKVATPEGYSFVANGEANARYAVTYDVVNASSGKNDSLTTTFVVVNEYTPMIAINKDALLVYPTIIDDKVVVPTIDKYSLFAAYDGKYCATTQDIRGTVITEFADVQCPTLDWSNPTEGKHVVTVTAKSVEGTKSVTKQFVLNIMDITAPVAYSRSVVLPYGSDFDCRMGITVAYDQVDGDLLQSGAKWWSDQSRTAVNTQKPGEYIVKLAVYDNAANEGSITYKVTVLPQGVTLKEVKDALEESFAALDDVTLALDDLADDVAAVKADVASVKSDVAAVKADVTGVKADVAGAVAKVDAAAADIDAAISSLDGLTSELDTVKGFVTPKGCKSKSAILVEFLAAASLLVLVLKRKH